MKPVTDRPCRRPPLIYSLTFLGQRLVADNLPLAYWWVKRFLHARSYLHPVLADLRGAAYLGLCRAAAEYEPAAGKFSTWAWRPILYGLRRVEDKFLAAQQRANQIPVSQLPPAPDQGCLTPETVFRDRPAHIERRHADLDLVARLLTVLPWRAACMVADHVMAGVTLEDVGVKWRVTRERARQIILKGVRRMQREAARRGLVWNEMPAHLPSDYVSPSKATLPCARCGEGRARKNLKAIGGVLVCGRCRALAKAKAPNRRTPCHDCGEKRRPNRLKPIGGRRLCGRCRAKLSEPFRKAVCQ